MTLDRTGNKDDPEEILYCTPEDVAEAMGLPVQYGMGDGLEYYTFSDMTFPTRRQVLKQIRANMDVIDRLANRAWRPVQVKERVMHLNTYQHDAMKNRNVYIESGGYALPLNPDVLPWDPKKGDRLELRNRHNDWYDVSLAPEGGEGTSGPIGKTSFFIDHHAGRLILRRRLLGPYTNSIRITYRYGSTDPVPANVERLCTLMTAVQVVGQSVYDIKVGSGGDLSGIKDQLINNWNMEIGELRTSVQRPGRVRGLTR